MNLKTYEMILTLAQMGQDAMLKEFENAVKARRDIERANPDSYTDMPEWKEAKRNEREAQSRNWDYYSALEKFSEKDKIQISFGYRF